MAPTSSCVVKRGSFSTYWDEWAKGENNYSEKDNAVYKKSIETAANLKEMGLTNEQIADATGLTIREIDEL